MLRRGVDVGAHARDCAIGGFELGHAKVRDLDGLSIAGEQEILRLHVTMNHAALMSMSESGAKLLKITERPFKA